MSEENKNDNTKPEAKAEDQAPKPVEKPAAPAAKPAAAAAKPAAKAPAEPPPPPEPGEYQNYLESELHIKGECLGKNANGTEMIEIDSKDWVNAVTNLKRKKGFDLLNNMTALELKKGYQVIIQLDNMNDAKYVVLKTTTEKAKPSIPSLTAVYKAADWYEREAYDMLGINFEGHSNMTRILNPDNWEGYPLRKDYVGPVDELNQPLRYAGAK